MYLEIYDQILIDFEKVADFESYPKVETYAHPVYIECSTTFVNEDFIKLSSLKIVLGHHMDERFDLSSKVLDNFVKKFPEKIKVVEVSKTYAVLRTTPDDNDLYYEVLFTPQSFIFRRRTCKDSDPVVCAKTKEYIVDILKVALAPLKLGE